MKKKGLIISTIVMVVVLIASLTTATYAWFNNSGSAKVSDITFRVESSADVKIGVAATNTYKSNVGFDDFYSEGTVYTAAAGGVRNGVFGTEQHGTWEGENNDLGLNINLPFDTWQPTQAVFSATARTVAVPAQGDTPATPGSATLTTAGSPAVETFNPDAIYMIKANGNNGDIDNATIGDAIMNTDFLHIGFGAVAGSTNVRSFGVWIYIDKTDEKPSVGILAGLHVAYRINNGTWTDVDLYGEVHQDSSITSTTNPIAAPEKPYLQYSGSTNKYTYKTDITPAAGDAALWVPLATSASATTALGTTASDIVQFEMVMYLDGTDEDSITTALKNNSAKISILFLAVNGGQEADD